MNQSVLPKLIMPNQLPNEQSAYHEAKISETSDIDNDIYAAMRSYLTEDLGLSVEFAQNRASEELLRKIPANIVNLLIKAGINFADSHVLDLGSGLGGMSEELVIRGTAQVTAIEPGKAWANTTRRRVERHNGRFQLFEATGESIPLSADSVDLVISLQVLEHVNDPDKVLAEVWRVLRPGGYFYLACENYLAFREAHYHVFWLPLLPKAIGRLYLKALGRPVKFLNESITYITYPGVLNSCRQLGFIRIHDEEMLSHLKTKAGIKWRLLRGLYNVFGESGPLYLNKIKFIFKFGIYELFRKP